jgi:FAD/FMN-containing dehydrogenase
MPALEPTTDSELAASLLEAAREGRSIVLGETISTRAMTRILKYEPRDLTISVEAGVRYADLTRRLATDGLMLPLDPPWADAVTVAGLVSANLNGPRRRLYGTARDLVIGMRFATLDGQLADTGGMVVKNVAGLDMAKMLIGSHGTLAAIASVNFKLIPLPKQSRTIVFETDSILQRPSCVGLKAGLSHSAPSARWNATARSSPAAATSTARLFGSRSRSSPRGIWRQTPTASSPATPRRTLRCLD